MNDEIDEAPENGAEFSQVDTGMEPVGGLNRSRMSVVERIQQMNVELARLSKERDSLASHLDQEGERAENFASQLKLTDVELDATRKELDLQRQERDNLAAKLEKEGERAEELAAKLKMAEVELNAARKEIDLQQEDKGRLQLERTKLQEDLRAVRGELEKTLRSRQKLQTELSMAKSALRDIERAFGK